MRDNIYILFPFPAFTPAKTACRRPVEQILQHALEDAGSLTVQASARQQNGPNAKELAHLHLFQILEAPNITN